ncbi:MAG: hypothetical protein JO188_02390 [Hyphomicrobiales bacterium]|nr:hypothetical protein [Hyphomicrobiales bacterium]
MGHIISLSEAARAMPSRRREPVPSGGATISLFLGVRYERWGTANEGARRQTEAAPAVASQPASKQGEITTADVA